MVLKYEKRDKTAYITFNRPEALNAFNPEMFQAFSQALIDFRDDPQVWVGIITGAGDRAFCAGADIKTLLPRIRDEWAAKPHLQPATIMRGLEITKPLIAAVNGFALGGGMEVALACDIRLAADRATFGLPEVRIGILPGWGGCSRLPRLIPQAKAAEILLTGQPISAEEAYRIGLVNEVVSADQLMAAAERWAGKLLEPAPLAVRAIKEIMNKGMNMGLEENLALEWEKLAYLFSTQDAREGLQAFGEKRKAHFQGK